MATSIQRIIIMLILLDLSFIIVTGFAMNTNSEELEFQRYTGTYRNWSDQYNNGINNPNPDTATSYLDRSFGDLKYGGKMVFELFSGGVNIPDKDMCGSDTCSYSYGRWIWFGVTFVLVIINVLAGYEIFQVLYAKKNT